MRFRPDDEEQAVKRKVKSKTRPSKLLTPESEDVVTRLRPILQETVSLLQEVWEWLRDQPDECTVFRNVLRLYTADERDDSADDLVVEEIERLLGDELGLAVRLVELVKRNGDGA